MAEWKDTCNLPRTSFSMKANLQTAEPEAIARWDAMDLYGQIRSARKGAKRYLLHDGPPYANGEIHLGTTRTLGSMLIEHGLADPFKWRDAWVQYPIRRSADVDHALWLFRLRYDQLTGTGVAMLRQRILSHHTTHRNRA